MGAAKVQENRGLIDTQPVRGAMIVAWDMQHRLVDVSSGHLHVFCGQRDVRA